MTISMYAASIPLFKHNLQSLAKVLKKGEAMRLAQNSNQRFYLAHDCFRTCMN